MPFVDPFCLKLIEGGLLVRMRPKIKEHWWPGVAASWPALRKLQRQLHPSAKFFIIWSELLKFLIRPKGVERSAEAFDNVRCFHFAQLDCPFDPVFKSGSRPVGGTDIDAAEAIISLKQP